MSSDANENKKVDTTDSFDSSGYFRRWLGVATDTEIVVLGLAMTGLALSHGSLPNFTWATDSYNMLMKCVTDEAESRGISPLQHYINMME